MEKFIGIIVGLLILSVILIIHEAGHFFVGRKLGFKVVEFSIFMGPRIFSWTKDDVRYSIKLIPLGASVEFAGEYSDDGEYIPTEGDFFSQSIWKRALTMLAGPGANLIAASLAFIILFSIAGFQTTEISNIASNSLASMSEIKEGEIISEIADYKVNTDLDLKIATIIKDLSQPFTLKTIDANGKEQNRTITPQNQTVYRMGINLTVDENKSIIVYSINSKFNPDADNFVLGDKLVKIEGQEVNINNYEEILSQYDDKKPLKVAVIRGNTESEIEVPLVSQEIPVPLGIELSENKNWYDSFLYAFKYQWSYVKGTVLALGKVISGGLPAKEALTGPVGIVDTFSNVLIDNEIDWGLKLINLLSLFGAISLALGVTNLIPMSPMDGGQLFLLIIEKIRGKRLSVKVENIIALTGVVLLLLLFVMALRFDLGRIFNF